MSAIEYLVYLIDKGVEYPEAEYRTVVKYNIDPDDLRLAYDSLYL